MSDAKVTTKVLSDAIEVSEHASVVKFTGDRIAGFTESERQKVRSSAEGVGVDVQSHLSGRPPQGENDTLLAASILVSALNASGGKWGPVTESVDPADCETTDADGRILLLQIARASQGSLWKRLAKDGAVQTNSKVTDLVTELQTAIEKKAARYPRAVRAQLVLGLDANRLPGFIMSNVREEAIARLQPICKQVAFSTVWVIGPTSELTYALHESGAPARALHRTLGTP